MSDDYAINISDSKIPAWLLHILRSTLFPNNAWKILQDQYFDKNSNEQLLFARSIDDKYGVICSSMGRIIYFDKQLHDGVPKYTESVHNFTLTPSLINHLLSMNANDDYNAVIKLCINVVAETNHADTYEKIKSAQYEIEQCAAVKKIEVCELRRARDELMASIAKINSFAVN